jgi:plasmid stability protein
MSSSPLDHRRFSEKEVREILARAVEPSTVREGDDEPGVSLAELQSIAREVGIAPERVETAARAVVGTENARSHPLLGMPRQLEVERRVRGELQPADVPDVLATIRRAMGKQGSAQEVLGTLEWRSSGDAGSRLITVSSRGETTTVGGVADLRQLAIVAYLPAGIISLVTTLLGVAEAAQAGSALGVGLALAVVPVAYTGLRALVKRLAASQARTLESAVDAVARAIEKR